MLLTGASLRSRMQYKLDFLTSAVTYGFIMAIDFILLAAILNRFSQVKGWGLFEVGVLYGVSSTAFSLFRTLAPEIHEFDKYMIHGEFDSLLIRPVSPLFLLITKNLDLGRVGGVVQGLIILGISLVGLSQENRVSLLLLLYIPIAVIVGTVISFALGVGTAAIGFWTHQIREIQVFTLYASFNAANYPVSLYPSWLKAIFYTVIPVAFVNYVPIVYLLGKGGNWYNLLLAPLVAAASLMLSLRLWNYGIRHYHSTGS